MFLYRIAKTEKRAKDLSGTGAFRFGGRWNNKGTYLLYTSENSSLALLENSIHEDESELPSRLFITQLEIKKTSLIYTLPEKDYPSNWLQLENIQNKLLGDLLMKENKYVAVKIRSAINQFEYNYLLNPLYPKFHDLVTIVSAQALKVNERLVK